MSVDIAFLIALDEEFRVLRAKVGTWTPVPNKAYGGEDYRFAVDFEGQGVYECVACFIDEMGPGHAGDATHRILDTWSPALVISIGIAASLHPSDLRLGDVAVVSAAQEYSSKGKISETNGELEFERGGEYYRVPSTLIASVRNFEFSEHSKFVEWKDICSQRYINSIPSAVRDLLISEKKLRPEPAVVRCDLASGPVVGAASRFSKWLRASNRHIKALEMEAAGVLRAIAARPTSAQALVLRGISDLADAEKSNIDAIEDGVIRQTAMMNVLDLVWALMATGRLPRRGEMLPASRSSTTVASRTVPEQILRTSPASDQLKELKAGVLDPHASVAQLARMALAYSRSIGDRDFSVWIKNELDGFIGKDEIPPHRQFLVKSFAHLRDFSREVRNFPVPLQSIESTIRKSPKLSPETREQMADIAHNMNYYVLPFGLAEVEEHSKGEGGTAPWPDSLMHVLLGAITEMEILNVWQSIPSSMMGRVLDVVRNRIFDYVHPEVDAQ